MSIVCVGPLHPICLFFFGFARLQFLVWGFHWLWVARVGECVHLMRLLLVYLVFVEVRSW